MIRKPGWKGFDRSNEYARRRRQLGALSKSVNKHRSAAMKWAKEVKERDEYVCQRPHCPDCHNVPSKSNHAHHIAPRSRRPDLKRELSNGLTLCFGAHDWVHSHPIEATELGLLSDETYEIAMRKEAA